MQRSEQREMAVAKHSPRNKNQTEPNAIQTELKSTERNPKPGFGL